MRIHHSSHVLVDPSIGILYCGKSRIFRIIKWKLSNSKELKLNIIQISMRRVYTLHCDVLEGLLLILLQHPGTRLCCLLFRIQFNSFDAKNRRRFILYRKEARTEFEYYTTTAHKTRYWMLCCGRRMASFKEAADVVVNISVLPNR